MNKRIITLKKHRVHMRFQIAGLQELDAFACAFAKQLRGGDVLAFSGELGSGKTACVKALAKVFGIKKTVTSPTFVLMNIYAFPKPYHGAIQLCHIDAYRLKSARDLDAMGADEYIGNPKVITAIEWPDQVNGSFFKNAFQLRFRIPKK